MKTHDDLPQLKREIQSSLSVFSWVMVTFAIIALAGWLVGYLIR